jgi:hypothetical protein
LLGGNKNWQQTCFRGFDITAGISEVILHVVYCPQDSKFSSEFCSNKKTAIKGNVTVI